MSKLIKALRLSVKGNAFQFHPFTLNQSTTTITHREFLLTPPPHRHHIDVKTLETYLTGKIPGFKAPLDVSQFKFGQSNPTYLLADAK